MVCVCSCDGVCDLRLVLGMVCFYTCGGYWFVIVRLLCAGGFAWVFGCLISLRLCRLLYDSVVFWVCYCDRFVFERVFGVWLLLIVYWFVDLFGI